MDRIRWEGQAHSFRSVGSASFEIGRPSNANTGDPAGCYESENSLVAWLARNDEAHDKPYSVSMSYLTRTHGISEAAAIRLISEINSGQIKWRYYPRIYK